MAEKNIVPNLETKATYGNPVFTPRQWLEKFKQFTKREHKIDITTLLKGEELTPVGPEKNKQYKKIWGVGRRLWEVGPEALFQITRAEYKTDPDIIKIKDLIRLYTEYYLSKRKTYHN